MSEERDDTKEGPLFAETPSRRELLALPVLAGAGAVLGACAAPRNLPCAPVRAETHAFCSMQHCRYFRG